MKYISLFILFAILSLPGKICDFLCPCFFKKNPVLNHRSHGASMNPGDTIIAPGVGITFIVPEGWSGILPQKSEIAFLLPQRSEIGYLFLMARERDFSKISETLKKTIPLTDEISLISSREPEINGNVATGFYEVIGTINPSEAYVKAKEGPYGVAAVYALITTTDLMAKDQPLVDQMIEQTRFSEPREAGMYDDFDWSKRLKDKYLVQYKVAQNYRVKAEIWLCSDGTFTTKFKEGGPVKGEKSQYKGRHNGTWTAEGVGPNGKLTLNYQKKEPLVLDMKMEDEKAYVNSYRFYFLMNDKCK
jgi:hypothetical protein